MKKLLLLSALGFAIAATSCHESPSVTMSTTETPLNMPGNTPVVKP
ncbi:MAG TPA: hypothetical protein VHB48_20730 [Chitinophagaceae bacterium]|nr:hypothetical protein [Chitinophagaceae bacterium]